MEIKVNKEDLKIEISFERKEIRDDFVELLRSIFPDFNEDVPERLRELINEKLNVILKLKDKAQSVKSIFDEVDNLFFKW